MTNPKGTAFASSLIPYYKQTWPYAEHARSTGAKDKADTTGIPLPLEFKNYKEYQLEKWSREAAVEAVNADALFVPVVFKRKGTTDPAKQFVLLENWMLVELMLAWQSKQWRRK